VKRSRVLRGTRVLVPLVAALASLSLRCNTVLDIGSNSPSDATFDAAGCGIQDGTCRPGQGCDRELGSHCVCDDSHFWNCSPPDDCPKTAPKPHDPCTHTGPACIIPNPCGGFDSWFCEHEPGDSGVSTWRPVKGRCVGASRCPPDAPPPDSPCDKFAVCRFQTKPCGVWYDGICDGTSWRLSPPLCTSYCPTVAPAAGSKCPADALECEWKNGCGTSDYAVCTDKGWTVITTCKPLDCPPAAPTAGSACSTEGTTCGWPGNCDAGHVEATCTAGVWTFTPGCK
jgi:hypothetical protein